MYQTNLLIDQEALSKIPSAESDVELDLVEFPLLFKKITAPTMSKQADNIFAKEDYFPGQISLIFFVWLALTLLFYTLHFVIYQLLLKPRDM